jgi:hypothetical protein
MAPTLAAGQQPTSSAFDPPTAAERMQLRQLLGIVRQADRVVALPVVAAGTGLSMEWAVAEKPVPVPLATGRALGRRLVGFDWERMSAKACGFQPGVAFRFYDGAHSAQVLICFACGEMALDGLGGALGNKKMLADADLAAWRRAAQQAFPAGDFRSLP